MSVRDIANKLIFGHYNTLQQCNGNELNKKICYVFLAMFEISIKLDIT